MYTLLRRASGSTWKKKKKKNSAEPNVNTLLGLQSYDSPRYPPQKRRGNSIVAPTNTTINNFPFTYGQRRFHRCIIRFMWVVSAKVQWPSNWPSQTQPKSRKSNLFQYMVNSLDLVKFFGAVGPIYRGELLLNFIIFITCMQYYIQRSILTIAWYCRGVSN